MIRFPRQIVACTFVWLSIFPLTSVAHDGGISRATLDQAFHANLQTLAERCDQLELADQARQTREWIIRRDPQRQYIFVPIDADPTKPPAAAPSNVHFWHRKFLEHRQAQAAGLFELAKQTLEKHQPTRAYQLLHEVLREDPDHAEARRILGYHQTNGRWRRRGASSSSKSMRTAHPLFGWRPGSYWRIETEHFEITTNHSDREGLKLGAQLEELYDVWQQLFFRYWSSDATLTRWFEQGAVARRSTKKHRVVLFRDRAEYLQALATRARAQEVSEGIYLYDQGTAWFYAGDQSAVRTWYHEATHQLFHEIGGAGDHVGHRDNFWIIEGIALYMESLTPRDGYCTIGGFDARRLQFARYWVFNQRYYLPLAELTRMGRDALQGHEQIGQLYSQSAGLAHFLIDYRGGQYREAVTDYLKLIYVGSERPDSLANASGVDLEQLDAQYREYLAVTDADLIEHLNPPASVTVLLLGQTDVSDVGVKVLSDYKQLEWLDLSYTKTTDEGLASISGLTNLKELWLTGAEITDAGLTHLRNLKQLERLELAATNVTPEGLAKLKQSLPSLQN